MSRGQDPGRGSEHGAVARWLCRAAIVLAALFPFVVWPGIVRPFSTPKIVLLVGFTVIAGFGALIVGRFRWPALPPAFGVSLVTWPVVLSVSALFGEFVSQQAFWLSLFSTGWFLLVTVLRPKAEALAFAVAASCAVTAVIALLQYLGIDLFRFFGWATAVYESPRMRVVGTLGNPNFVAAFLVGGMPLTFAWRNELKPRMLFPLVIVLEGAALFATGSRAAIGGIGAILIWLGVLGRLRRWRRWRALVAVALLLIALIPLMPSRSFTTTLEGRFYIWRITAPHLFEHPLFGFGPGGFEAKFIEWETAYWRDGKGSEDLRRFAGLQAHAHNDYLEILVDHGWAGLLVLVVLLGSFLGFAFHQSRKTQELGTAASAGVVALATVAVVDFPLHRPTELFLFWTLMAVAYLDRDNASSNSVALVHDS